MNWKPGDITDRGEIVLRAPTPDGWLLVWLPDSSDTTTDTAHLVRIGERKPSRLTAARWSYEAAAVALRDAIMRPGAATISPVVYRHAEAEYLAAITEGG